MDRDTRVRQQLLGIIENSTRDVCMYMFVVDIVILVLASSFFMVFDNESFALSDILVLVGSLASIVSIVAIIIERTLDAAIATKTLDILDGIEKTEDKPEQYFATSMAYRHVAMMSCAIGMTTTVLGIFIA